MSDHLIAIARDDYGRAALHISPEHAARIRAELGRVVGERSFPLGRVIVVGETRLSLYPIAADAAKATIALLSYANGRPRPPLLFDDPIDAIVAMSWEYSAGRRIEGVGIVHSDSISDLFVAMGRSLSRPPLPAVTRIIDEGSIDPDAWCPRCLDHHLTRDREAGPHSLVDGEPICAPCQQLELARLAYLAALARGATHDPAAE
jgi:hypothetical protein